MIARIATITFSVAGDAVRRKIAWVVAFFALIMVSAIPLLPSYGAGVVEGVFREVGIAVMFAAALIVVLSLMSGLLPSQVERRTVYSILAKPVARWELLAGVWLGVFLTMAWVVAAFAVVTIAAGYLEYGHVMWRIWQGALAVWLESGVVAAFVLAVSTRTSPLPAVLAALVFVFVGHSRSSLLTPDDGLLWSLYPSLDAFNVANPVAHGSGISLVYVAGMLAVFAAYAALLLLAAVTLFHGRDL